MSMRAFDLVGTIHGREYSDHGEYVTADDYYHLKLYSEAVDRLKLGMEIELENLKTENERLIQLPTRNALIKAREQLIDERDQLKAENESLRKDAERYVHLKKEWQDDFLIGYLDSNVHSCGWDEVIDARMNRSPENPS